MFQKLDFIAFSARQNRFFKHEENKMKFGQSNIYPYLKYECVTSDVAKEN